MKFTVERVSEYGRDPATATPPVPGAVLESVVRRDSAGREWTLKEWTLVVPDLDALLDLVAVHGKTIVQPTQWFGGTGPGHTLTIYDYYIE